MLNHLHDGLDSRMTSWVVKNLGDIAQCERLFMPLNNSVHWALAIYEVKLNTLFILDSIPPSFFESEVHLLLKISQLLYDKLEEKRNWIREWQILYRKMELHAALYHLKATPQGELPKVQRQSPETWRFLVNSCLETKSFNPLESAFIGDISLK